MHNGKHGEPISELASDDPTKPNRLAVMLASRLLGYMRNGITHKECPQLWPAIHGRKYLLPKYRQADYADQSRLNEDFEFSMLSTAMGIIGFGDEVHHAMYSNFCGALWYDRPVLFLERELAEPLAESSLPLDMVVEDIEWTWPQVRIMLPKGFMTIERDGKPRSLLFLDLVKLDANGVALPPKYAVEAENLCQRVFRDAQLPRQPIRPAATTLRVSMREPYMAVVGGLDWSELGSDQGTSYASIVPWNNKKLGELLADKGPNLRTGLKLDNADDVLLARMQQLAFNALLFLSQKPMVYKPDVVRPLKREGKHVKPALHNAHFLGQEQYRHAIPARHSQETAQEAAARGLILKEKWKKGHWKRQPYGPKNALRRWQWVQVYFSHVWTKEEHNENKDRTASGETA